MPIPTRLLRSEADDLPGARPRLTDKERARETQIIAAATALMARFGRNGMTMTRFAHALRIAHCTLRNHFPDLDSLLAEILYRHLAAICTAIGAAPALPAGATIAQRRAARRAAYIGATRTPFNAPTQAHVLLLRERHSLPQDLLGPIEALRLQIGELIDGPDAEAALALLDTPNLQAPQIEAMLAAIPPQEDSATPAASPPATFSSQSEADAFVPEGNNITWLPSPRPSPWPMPPSAGPPAGPH